MAVLVILQVATDEKWEKKNGRRMGEVEEKYPRNLNLRSGLAQVPGAVLAALLRFSSSTS